MKKIIFCILLFSGFNTQGQNQTYSKYEEDMVLYANNGWSYSTKYDSVEYAEENLDSCWRFLKAFPNSFARGNVFSMMLEMTIFTTDDIKKIFPLIDSVLIYDNLPATRLRMGEILIQRNLDIDKGRKFLIDAFHNLTVKHHKFRAYMLMASSDISLGNNASAETNYEKDLKLEPERIHAWYEYLGFSIIREFPQKAKTIKLRIKELEEKYNSEYVKNSTSSVNVNKDITNLLFYDLDSNQVKLNDYREKVIIINKFNFWCGVCVKEFPILKKIMKQYPKVEFLFVNYGENAKELKEVYFSKPEFSFLKSQTVVFGNKQFSKNIYGNGVPHTFVIDKKGKIRFEYLGYNENLEGLLKSNIKKLNLE